jgi:hypothetical protein
MGDALRFFKKKILNNVLFVQSLEHKKLLPAKFPFVPGCVPSCLQPLIFLSWSNRNFAGDKGELCQAQLLML